jgi:hypothetical protein
MGTVIVGGPSLNYYPIKMWRTVKAPDIPSSVKVKNGATIPPLSMSSWSGT